MYAPRTRALFVIGLTALFLAACGGGGGGSGGGVGTMSLKITDAPFPATDGCVSAAKIEIKEATAKGPDGFVTLLAEADGPVTIDLWDLRAGISENLALADIPTGAYSEIRLVVNQATIEFEDGSTPQDFKIPSGMSSGLKIKIDPPVLIASGQTSEVMLDVNLTESFHTTGLGGEPTCDDLKAGETMVIFRPVIRAINEAETALVVGVVSDDTGAPLGDAEVCAFPAGMIVDNTTVPTAMTLSTPASMEPEVAAGSYALALEPGDYDLYVRPQGTEAKVLIASGVSVAAGDIVTQDLMLPAP